MTRCDFETVVHGRFVFVTLRGEFDMHVTLSPLEKFVRPYKPVTIDPEWTLRDLVGKTIQMTGHAPVTGAGVSGRVLVREHVTPG